MSSDGGVQTRFRSGLNLNHWLESVHLPSFKLDSLPCVPPEITAKLVNSKTKVAIHHGPAADFDFKKQVTNLRDAVAILKTKEKTETLHKVLSLLLTAAQVGLIVIGAILLIAHPILGVTLLLSTLLISGASVYLSKHTFQKANPSLLRKVIISLIPVGAISYVIFAFAKKRFRETVRQHEDKLCENLHKFNVVFCDMKARVTQGLRSDFDINHPEFPKASHLMSQIRPLDGKGDSGYHFPLRKPAAE